MGGQFLDEVFALGNTSLRETWERPRNLLAFWAPLIGVPVALVGLLVLYAWAAGIGVITTFGAGLASMKPNTAFCLVLAGTTLALNSKFFAPYKFRRAQMLLAGVMLTLATATYFEIFLDVDLGIDNIFYVAESLRGSSGRMSDMAAVQFVLVGVALMLLLTYRKQHTMFAGSMVAASFLISVFAIVSFWLESHVLYRQPNQSMAVHTALSFLALSLGVIGVVIAANWKAYGVVDVKIMRLGLVLWGIAAAVELVSAYFVLRITTSNDVVLFTILVFKFVIMIILFAAVVAAGVVLMSFASREQEELRERLVANERMFREAFMNARQGIEVVRRDGSRVDINRRACEIFGRSREELLREPVWDSTKDSDIGVGKISFARLAGGEIDSYEREKRIIRGDGEERWVRAIAGRGIESNDHEATFVIIIEDIQKAKDAEQARDLLIGEINHRVKNTLAVIQGMIGKLQLTHVTADELATALTGRIANLGASYDLLNRKDWSEPALAEVFNEAMRSGFDVYRDRFDCRFAPAKVNSQAAIYLGLIFHELITNSVKYGALQSDAGHVDIVSTTENRDGQIWGTVTWTERGGPKVEPPKTKGFGSFVLEKGVSFGLSGTCEQDFSPDGLKVTWRFPVGVAE